MRQPSYEDIAAHYETQIAQQARRRWAWMPMLQQLAAVKSARDANWKLATADREYLHRLGLERERGRQRRLTAGMESREKQAIKRAEEDRFAAGFGANVAKLTGWSKPRSPTESTAHIALFAAELKMQEKVGKEEDLADELAGATLAMSQLYPDHRSKFEKATTVRQLKETVDAIETQRSEERLTGQAAAAAQARTEAQVTRDRNAALERVQRIYANLSAVKGGKSKVRHPATGELIAWQNLTEPEKRAVSWQIDQAAWQGMPERLQPGGAARQPAKNGVMPPAGATQAPGGAMPPQGGDTPRAQPPGPTIPPPGGQTQPSPQPQPAGTVGQGRIRVRHKESGTVGTILEKDFDPDVFERV